MAKHTDSNRLAVQMCKLKKNRDYVPTDIEAQTEKGAIQRAQKERMFTEMTKKRIRMHVTDLFVIELQGIGR